ncbi:MULTISPECIES: tRNA uracil 4-sulfurtransferase ThiI [unclassified Clostridioides]|uniref:tRNA uracil 4-sulfurtransferase ThiI n=1 Tax=unclassified Clostridioides TaxID=2635829 RepID=UPI001D0C3F17|nr:tRNA 4-thiouridine(8) synthase ThiI [Clostridioides sp. ES-S-0001-02]MCC0681394.1 tRNA 4-thiouridine(8) synthase ThiI [Clostridioides sp. ES-S-0005-03]MCC0703920.1 tRNA 4-thiouridine(8) synthase ThiI [Clostridioides sp. ES-S-0049-02]MCC0705825.1 tRNA 4-thiouridine(8) synthase ThiI [Clostridioides sp. ES-S-0190-01]MCC0762347.1 tRNA 4-thiouridine(8) synthase ThiI [Clostridioides sp. ES-S-0006-03]UDN48270.1 tRNA 4-thiouridine(8) synthase ThiI [Clostridioides sp. ES-S-0173-01]UDN57749.1 tRNA 4
MVYNILIVKYGEIGVKGKNRYIFENRLIRNIRNMLKPIGKFNVYKEYGRIYVDLEDYDYEEVIEEVRKVFGIVGVCPGVRAKKDYDTLKEIALKMLEEKIDAGYKTFKVESRRGDKSFRLTSQEMSMDIGGYLLSKVGDRIDVDVRNPEVKIKCEYREFHTMVYSDTIPGYGGLPLGTNGRAMSLLSGGIDSPVATWMVAKRGMEVEAVHFHSYPFTSERSQEKVKDLAKILAKYCGRVRLHKVNILEIQKAIGENCNEEEATILSRRFMMRIAQKLSEKRHCDALITGESIGQVASQTIQGLTCTNAVVNLPVFRPLIAMDKSDIVDIAKKIGTFETSIIPEEDCCSVFSPRKPVTKPRLEKIEKSELSLDIEKLVQDAIDGIEVEDIEF